MKGVLLVFFLSWCGFAPVLILVTTFFSHVVFSSSGDTDRGLQRGMYGIAVLSAAQWLGSLALPPVIHRLGIRASYASLQVLATFCYVALYLLPRQPGKVVASTAAMTLEAFALLAVLGLHYAAMNTVPYAMVATGDQAPPSQDAGMVMGIVNSGSVVAQGLVNVAASFAIARTQDISVGISIGAAPAAVACLVAAVVLPGREKPGLESAALLDSRVLNREVNRP